MIDHYPTPSSISRLIHDYLPRNVSSLLEPAVGDGAFLYPVIEAGVNVSHRVTIVDLDFTRLRSAIDLLSFFPAGKLDPVHGDFLEVSKNWRRRYDCIVMNPPFMGRSELWVNYLGARVPIEVAFFMRSMSLLSDDGVIFAVLPATLISGKKFAEFRRSIFDVLSINFVYELNNFSFSGVEGRFYLLCGKMGQKSGRNVLMKSASSGAVASIDVPMSSVRCNGYRMDFSYYINKFIFDKYIEESRIDWCKVLDVASVVRGAHSAPFIRPRHLHTTSFVGGLCRDPAFGLGSRCSAVNPFFRGVAAGDIVVKRVGRNCHRSFSVYQGHPTDYTDCVLRLRVMSEALDPRDFLFSMRVLYSGNLGKDVLVKGTGASFISVSEVGRLPFPVGGMGQFHRKAFSSYCAAIASSDWEEMQRIETDVRGLAGIPDVILE